jgi:hypothetical protein
MLRFGTALIMAAILATAGCGDEDADRPGSTRGEADDVGAAGGAVRGPSCAPNSGTGIYRDLRQRALNLDPHDAGLRPTAVLPRVFGVMMETGLPEGCATLVGLADGTASLYLSSGGGVIGGGQHAEVAQAVRRFVQAAEESLDVMPAARRAELPAVGWVVLRALTYKGRHEVEVLEDDLGYDRHQLSPLFYAGHDVITMLRRIEEAQSRSK